MEFLYNLAIHIYLLLVRFASLHNKKARAWLRGRKGQWSQIEAFGKVAKPTIWFHAASLGEFEQGRPLMEAFRKEHPEFRIFLTFFSPSGYEIRKNYPGADLVVYLPFDSRKNAERLATAIQPRLAVFIKYEYWFHYLNTLYRHQVPVVVVSAIFRKDQHFFRWYGGWFRKQLRKIDSFFVQNLQSLELLKSIGIRRAVLSGDTRFDRVTAIADTAPENELVKNFASGHRVILAGSSWPADEAILAESLKKMPENTRLIIAPHEIHDGHIQQIEELFGKGSTLRYSKYEIGRDSNAIVLIIDQIGFLSQLYRYCDVAFIGGGFGKGIHNILEAVVYGKPVLFGPNYLKFNEAVELVQLGGAFPVSNAASAYEKLNMLLNDNSLYSTCNRVCTEFINTRTGATKFIMTRLREFIISKRESE